MKKYKIIYIVLILICIVMIVTKGITVGTTIKKFGSQEMANIDGDYGYIDIFIFNICILLAIFIVSVCVTFNKKNNIKFKYIILLLVFILLLWLPIGMQHNMGGSQLILGRETYISLINMYLFFR